MKRLITYIGALSLTIAAAQVHAGIALSVLFGGASVQVGDKLFDDWMQTTNERCSSTVCNDNDVDTTSIMVEGLGDGSAGNEYGLRFSSSNGALAIEGDNLLNLVFGFSVTATNPTKQIVGSSMTFTTRTQGTPFLVSVEKDIFEANAGNELGSARIFNGGGAQFLDDVGFAGQRSIYVEDTVLVEGSTDVVSAGVLNFTQRFFQRDIPPEPVPAPATLALFGLGLAGIGWKRRKKA